jgi:hypothetical protein
VSPPRPGVLIWKTPNTQELSQATQTRCRELLSHMLLAAVSGTREERDEREDPSDSH